MPERQFITMSIKQLLSYLDPTIGTVDTTAVIESDFQRGTTEEGVWGILGKQMLIESAANDIVLSSLFTGVSGNYLKPSINNAGLDANNLPDADKSSMNFGSGGNTDAKAWKDIWGSGQGIGGIKDDPSVGDLVERIIEEYNQAKKEFNDK